MITLTDIAYVRSGTADLDAAVRFAVDIVGLELAAPGERRRPPARRPPPPLPRPGRGRARGCSPPAFTVADSDALDAAQTELELAGVNVARGTRRRPATAGSGSSSPSTTRSATGSSWPSARSIARPVECARTAGITEFGHLCLDAPDVHEAYAFWTRRFNMRVSDWIGDAACLMRIDPVHHKFAVFHGDEPGLCHMNFQVESLDDVMRSWHFLVEQGVEIEMGPGRHPQSTAIFLYFKGPEGSPTSTRSACGASRMTPPGTRTFDPDEPESIDMWRGRTQMPTTQLQVDRPLGDS